MRISTSQTFTRGVDIMSERQLVLSKTQEKLATGKNILTPADDPSSAARILDLKEVSGTFEQFNRNASRATSDLGYEEGVVDTTVNLLQRIHELTLQGINGSLTQKDREIVALEIEERFSQLVQAANSKNGSEYMFSGFKTATQPFSIDTAGNVNYAGDQGQRQLQISPSRYVAINDSGYDVFMNIDEGNGTFVTAANNANTGNGVIDNGSVLNGASYVQDTYTINFVTNSAGDLAYTVTGASSGQVVPALPAAIPANAPAFSEGDAITFNGGQVVINGEPNAGDSYTVTPAAKQDIFSTINDLIAAFKGGSDSNADYAKMASNANTALGNISNALDNLDRVLAGIGGRMNAMEDEVGANESAILELESTRSRLEDLDYASAIGDFQLELAGLQAAQAAFAKIQNLSLFNYI